MISVIKTLPITRGLLFQKKKNMYPLENTKKGKNSLEIATSLTIFEIFAIFAFSAKIQDGCQKL